MFAHISYFYAIVHKDVERILEYRNLMRAL